MIKCLDARVWFYYVFVILLKVFCVVYLTHYFLFKIFCFHKIFIVILFNKIVFISSQIHVKYKSTKNKYIIFFFLLIIASSSSSLLLNNKKVLFCLRSSQQQKKQIKFEILYSQLERFKVVFFVDRTRKKATK